MTKKHIFHRLLKTVVCLLSTGNRQLATVLSSSIRDTQYGLSSTKDYVRKNNLFMQNKANFQKVKFDVTKVLTRGYVQMDTWSIGKTKPIKANSKPIKANSKPIKCQNKPNFRGKKCCCVSLVFTTPAKYKFPTPAAGQLSWFSTICRSVQAEFGREKGEGRLSLTGNLKPLYLRITV